MGNVILSNIEPLSSAGPSPVESDPVYGQALEHMQRGRWRMAAEALADLEHRYSGPAELKVLRERLSLHLSAEEGWTSAFARRLARAMKVPIIRALVIFDLLLYLVVGILLLMGKLTY
jgi:hypothetical protein